jgi:hypothetical protein
LHLRGLYGKIKEATKDIDIPIIFVTQGSWSRILINLRLAYSWTNIECNANVGGQYRSPFLVVPVAKKSMHGTALSLPAVSLISHSHSFAAKAYASTKFCFAVRRLHAH